MEINFKKNDIVEETENKISHILSKNSVTTSVVDELLAEIEEDINVIPTITSILFKIRSKSIYTKDIIDESKTFEEDSIELIENIIRKIYNSKDTNEIKRIIIENICVLKIILMGYFSEKQTNYIKEKFFIENIINQNKQKEVLALNPFMIIQLLDECANPLTEEELIINETIDYNVEAEQYFDAPSDIIYTLDKLKENSNGPVEYARKELFIISDVFQESYEKDISLYEIMKNIFDYLDYDPKKVTLYMNNNKKLLYQIVRKFVDYNINIKNNGLQELENKPAAQYAKRIYNKKSQN